MQLIKIALIISIIFQMSCKDKDDPMDDNMMEEDCVYQFSEDIAPIYGAWEPQQIINLEDGDTINYELGNGHFGFIFNDHYGDAFELRPDSTLPIYYVESGRHCADRSDGNWHAIADTIYITRFEGDQTKVPIKFLSQEVLVIEDVVNFKQSQCSMRKVNE